MNYTGKFDAVLPIVGLGPHSHAHGHFETISPPAAHAPSDAIIVPDAHLLFNGDFKRSGVDLILSKDDHELVVPDYFKGEKRAALSSPDGAHLTGDIVNALTGYVEYSQAGGSASVGKVIGHVTKLAGTATAIRNGVSIILNEGDNVEKGDVVQSGSNSTLGITFIDGTVFGLASNARMVLNEMVYDPNGSNNSSLLSLVAGTISFVAGETAKHGDMKVDTPVATMGIRGTACLVGIDFEIPLALPTPSAPLPPTVSFQVLVEPDGTTGSYILFDKTTLAPIATVNLAGQQVNISQGVVSLTSVPLSADVQKLITDVFSLKFTSTDTTPKTFDHFTDSIVPESLQPIMTASGATAIPIIVNVNTTGSSQSTSSSGPLDQLNHIPGAPAIAAFGGSFTERPGVTGSTEIDAVSGTILFADINAGDLPTASAKFFSFTYQDAQHNDITASLSAAQLAYIAALEINLALVPDPGNKNTGSTTWTWSVQDHFLDFLGAGETLTLTYMARVDNNFAGNDEYSFAPFTITLIGTEDPPNHVPVIEEVTSNAFDELSNPTGSATPDTVSGTIIFTDLDLFDRPVASASFTSFTYTDAAHNPLTLTAEQLADIVAVEVPLSVVQTAGNTNNGSATWTYSLADNKFDFLALGEILVLTYTATVDDGRGGVATALFTVTIAGTNDTPTIVSSTNDTPTRTEDSVALDQNLSAAGTITFQDVDLNDTHTATFVLSSTSNAHLPGYTDNISQIGTFVLTPATVDSVTGEVVESPGSINTATVDWTFTLADNDPVLQSLAFGETLTQIYTVTITDNNGAPVTQDVTVTLVGTNDAPTIVSSTNDTPTKTEDSVAPDQNLTAAGTITFQDVDLIDTHTATFVLKSSTSSAHLPGYTNNISQIGTFALTSATVDPSGHVVESTDEINTAAVGWTFTLADNNSVLQSLALGQTLTQIYTVTITDNNGAQVSKDITVTLVGTNDTPTLVSSTNDTPTKTEDSVAPDQNLTAAGTITFQDVDLIDTHTATFVLKSSTSSAHLPGYTNNISQIGTFALTSATVDPSGHVVESTDEINTAAVGWTFTLADNNSVLQSLALGQTLTQIYTVTITDNNGAQVSKDVTVTLVGTNDTPTLVSSTNDTPTKTEDSVAPDQNLTAAGTITFQDVDLIDTHTATFVLKSSTSNAHLPGYTDNISQIGTFALTSATVDPSGHVVESTDEINTAAVGWTFTLADNDPVLQSLALGETLTQIYTVTITDNNGAPVSKDVTVTLVGTNDTPTIVSSTNDTPTRTEDSVALDQNLTAAGTITFRDVDLIDTHTATFVLKSSTSNAHLPGYTDNISQIGTFTLTSATVDPSSHTVVESTDGINTAAVGWTFTLADNDPVLQSLALGETLTQIYTVTITDNNGAPVSKDVTVTLVGTNDTPTITAATTPSATVFEDSPQDAVGTITFQDVDLTDTHLITQALTSGSTSVPGFDPTQPLGTLTLTLHEDNTDTNNIGTVDWDFALDNALVQQLAAGQVVTQVYTVTIDDQHGGVVTQDITVTITGTNDAPVVGPDVPTKQANLANNNGEAVFDGQHFFGDSDLTVSDVDFGATYGIAITDVDNADGIWEYESSPGVWTPIVLDVVINGVLTHEWLVLSADVNVRFSGAGSGSTETLTFKAWDGTDGSTSGDLIPIPSDVGGTTAFSLGTYTVGAKNAAPAGVAGEPINLGLTESSFDLGSMVTVTIKDLPSDWIVNGGTHNADGSWTVQTTDVTSLSVTTPASFAGAVLLSVTEAVVQADGTTTTFTLGDNLEAYSQGSPIFAWSDNDFLTASTGNDLFVFAQPIGHDTVYSFDAAHDQIDLIGYAGFTSFADIQAHLADDANGDAVITLGDGQSIELQGVHAAALTQNNFVFNQTPALDNAGTMTIGDGAMLPLSGTINNTGTIALNSTGDETDLQLIEHGVTLEGGGQIVLSDSDANIISGTSSSVMLDNEDNTISGAGQLGDGELSLTNAGTINATGTYALTIDTGSNWVFNSGVLEASGSGGLTVASSIANSGVLWANGSTLTVQGEVSGNGTAAIDGTATLDLEASATVNVVFGSGAGTLKLGDSFHFNGTITGFGDSDSIDLANVASATASISYHENAAGTGGTLAISDGAQTVELSLLGDYSADNFSIVPDPVHGTLITYVPHDLML